MTDEALPIACGPPQSLEAEWLQLQFAARLVEKERLGPKLVLDRGI